MDTSLLDDNDKNYSLFASTFFISIVSHIIFIGGLFFIPGQSPQKHLMPSVISVNMVSFPSQEDIAPTGDIEEPESQIPLIEDLEVQSADFESPPVLVEEPDILPEPEKQAQVENIPETKEIVVLKDAPKQEKKEPAAVKNVESKTIVEKKPVKIKKINPQARKPKKRKEKAIAPENVKSESIKEAINRVRRKVARNIASQSSAGYGAGEAGSKGIINDIYKAQIIYLIEKNWAFSEQLLKKHGDLLVHIRVSVLSDGHFKDVQIKKRSGDAYLDDSAYRAVMKSNPFPPLPKEYPNGYTFDFRFNPSGLN